MKKGKKIIGLVVLLLLVLSVTVGYSYLSASLNINGTSKIKTASWDVHFNNIQTNNIKTTTNKNNLKIKQTFKPKKKYIKYITKISDKSTSSPKNLNNKNKISDKNYDKSNQNLNKKLKILKISPLHYRDCSGGKKKNISIYNKNILSLDSLSNRNRKINSGEKKYIIKTKNDIYNKGKKFLNKNKVLFNPFRDNKIINNIKVKNINMNYGKKIFENI